MVMGRYSRYSGSMKSFYVFVVVLLMLMILAIVFIPRAAASEGFLHHRSAPDPLKLNAAQQKQVDATPAPLSAIAVTCDGLALSLFIQLDADHLFRADPRQSDMFTAVKGKMVQSTAPPMEWKVAYAIAEKAILSSHVVVPCVTGDHT